MARRLVGKIAAVTASTDGIGFAIARRLGKEGARVMVSSRKETHVEKAVSTLKAENIDVQGMVCHVGKADHRSKLIEETVKQFGGLDILVSNAAVNPFFGNILDSTADQWDKMLDINIKAAFLISKEAVPHMEKRGGGSIIFVSSISGYNPFPLIAPYSVCKTALLGLVKAMTPACAEKNIRVNAIAPGIIKTHFSQALWSSPEAENATEAAVPLGRLGTPEDCGGTVAYLASDDASYVTGETIVIAGGMTSKL